MEHIYAVVQTKGGGSKTTVVANLGAALAARTNPRTGEPYRVLLLDLDPQGSLSLCYGIKERFAPESEAAKPSEELCAALLAGESIARFVRPTEFGVDVLPNGRGFEAFSDNLVGNPKKYRTPYLLLKRALEQLPQDRWDVVFIDTPGDVDHCSVNALVAATGVIVPCKPEESNLEEVPVTLRQVHEVRRDFSPTLGAPLIIVSDKSTRTKLAGAKEEELREAFGDAVCRTVIRNSVAVAECVSAGQPVTAYDPRANGTKDYRALAEEFEERCLATVQASIVEEIAANG